MVHPLNPRGLAEAATAVAGRFLRSAGRADTLSPPPRVDGSSPNDLAPFNDALHAKMARLLDRSVEQNTSDTRLELYDRILGQLVADEARILRALSGGTASPLVTIYSQSHRWSKPQVVSANVSLVGRTAGVTLPTMGPTYVANLLRLGLVEIGPEDPASRTGYEMLMADPNVLRAIGKAESRRHTARVERLSLRLSDLGHLLWAATMGGPQTPGHNACVQMADTAESARSN